MHTGKDTRLQRRTGVLFVRKTKEEENKRESSEQAAPSALSGRHRGHLAAQGAASLGADASFPSSPNYVATGK